MKKKKPRAKQTKVQKLQNLLKLGQKIKEVPTGHFNMNQWADDKASCGFAACALGWAPVLVPESGLLLRRDSCNVITVVYPDRHDPECSHGDLDAAMEAFGLEYEDANRLFMPDEYDECEGEDGMNTYSDIPPSVVSARIIAFAKKKLAKLEKRAK